MTATACTRTNLAEVTAPPNLCTFHPESIAVLSVQVPLFLLLGSLAYLFPQQALLIAVALTSWVVWQRQR